MFEPLEVPISPFDCIFTCARKRWFLKRFSTAEILEIVCSPMSFKMEVNKYMGSSAPLMADCSDEYCIDADIYPNLPSLASISEPFLDNVVNHSAK